MSNFKKVGNLKLETSAYEQKLNDTDIVFYNNDFNTSILMFQITKDKKPLLLNGNNVHIDIVLVAKDGSWLIDDEFYFEEPMNGKVSYQIPNWFLNHHGKVKAQVYIGINGKDDTVTEVEFAFTIKDDLINTVPAKEKIIQFRTFLELKNRILEQVQEIEDGMAHGSDYVSEMKTTVTEGFAQITKKVEESDESITNATSKFMNEIKQLFEETKNDIVKTKDNAVFTVNAKSEEALQNMENISKTTENKYNDMLTDFQSLIDNNSFVKPESLKDLVKKDALTDYAKKNELESFINDEELVSKLTDLDIQQFALTNQDGTVKFLNLSNLIENLKSLPSGLCYATNVPNLPNNITSTAGFMIVMKRNEDFSKYIYMPHNSNQTLVSYKNKNNTLEWKTLRPLNDTGWLPFNLINGAISNSSYMGSNGFVCSYRIIDHGDRREKSIRLNGKNITDKAQIAKLPVGFAENTQVHPIRTPQRSNGGFVTIYPDGKVNFFKTGDYEWYSDDDIYGEIRWIE